MPTLTDFHRVMKEKIKNKDSNRTKDRTIQKEQQIGERNYKIIGEYVKSKNNERKNCFNWFWRSCKKCN